MRKQACLISAKSMLNVSNELRSLERFKWLSPM